MNEHDQQVFEGNILDERGEDLISFPPSVERHLARADAALRQTHADAATAAFQAAGSQLAAASPELFVLAMATHMGNQSITFEENQVETLTTANERFTLGIRTSHDVQTVTRSRNISRTIRLE